MRVARQCQESDYFHITMRGIGRRVLFEDDADKRRFLLILKSKLLDSEVSTVSWCLMSNHIHVLCVGSVKELSRLMQRVGTSFAQYYNGRHGHVGSVFQNRYSCTPIESDSHLLLAIRYIHYNPVESGECRLEEYPWSSYLELSGSEAFLEGRGICDKSLVYGFFDGVEGFLRFHGDLGDEISLCEMTAPRNRMDDHRAREVAMGLIGENFSDLLSSLPKPHRNAKLRALKHAGLSVRQIERLTGIGRNIIDRA
ncbi:MAG: transposase [Eggerthellaceae bacterium]|nr:transposase [Eggerthellaceae bacterium]